MSSVATTIVPMATATRVVSCGEDEPGALDEISRAGMSAVGSGPFSSYPVAASDRSCRRLPVCSRWRTSPVDDQCGAVRRMRAVPFSTIGYKWFQNRFESVFGFTFCVLSFRFAVCGLRFELAASAQPETQTDNWKPRTKNKQKTKNRRASRSVARLVLAACL